MPNNRKEVGVPVPHPRIGNKISMEPSNGHRFGQVSQHKNNQIMKKEKIYYKEKRQYTPDWWYISDQTRQFMKD